MSLVRYSEPYAATGNLGDSGIAKLLGTPELDLMQTVVREAVQNCCDAAKYDDGPEIRFRLRTLSEQATEVLKKEVFKDVPPAPESLERFDRLHDAAQIRVLEICDFGTTGLAGPTRADRMPPGARFTDFIDFFRNVGSRRNSRLGGGTYGFGKVALYLLSRCSTIVVDTQTSLAGEPVRRLMAAHLGDAYDVANADGSALRFTGRHWWGCTNDADPVAEPLAGREAAVLAGLIGLPPRSVDQTGTSIMIVDPYLDGDSLDVAANRIVEILLWNFWPRMTRDVPSRQRLSLSVELDEQELTVPDPENYPPLDHYSRALAQIRSGSDGVELIHSQRPPKLLGRCAIEKGLCLPRRTGISSDDTVLPKNSASIALMRPVGLIVKYLPGIEFPDQRFEWGGVFVVDTAEDVEQAFASAEPPSHDTWQPNILEKGPAQTMVRVAVRKLQQRARSVVDEFTSGVPVAQGAGGPVAAVATQLGKLLHRSGTSLNSGRNGARRSTGRKRVRSAKPTVSEPVFERLEAHDSGTVAVFSASIKTGSAKACALDIRASPVVDGTLVRSMPESKIAEPTVLDVSGPQGSLDEEDGRYLVGMLTGDITVRVTMPPDVAVGVDIRLTGIES